MKKKIAILVTSIILSSIKINAQFFTFSVIPASCSSCCDASFTIEISYCTNTTFDATSNSLTLTQTVACCPYIFRYNNVCPGNYPFSTLQSELCSRVTQVVTIPFATSIFDSKTGIEQLFNMKVYPNPSHDVLKIDFENHHLDGAYQIKIVNVLGQMSNPSIPENSSNTTVDLSNLQDGIYFLQVWEKNQLISTKRFVKE